MPAAAVARRQQPPPVLIPKVVDIDPFHGAHRPARAHWARSASRAAARGAMRDPRLPDGGQAPQRTRPRRCAPPVGPVVRQNAVHGRNPAYPAIGRIGIVRLTGRELSSPPCARPPARTSHSSYQRSRPSPWPSSSKASPASCHGSQKSAHRLGGISHTPVYFYQIFESTKSPLNLASCLSALAPWRTVQPLCPVSRATVVRHA